ncbi:MAG: amidohydrolase family protein [Caulobacter sp.]|nr:amidohydrolase family protein [Caulobacter sp.]
MRTLLLAAAAMLIAGPASAETYAIVNARIETVSAAGAIPNGTIVLKDGKIVALGAGVTAPAGATVIDAKGGVVTPGFIAASSNLTVSEVEAVQETRDDRSGKLSAGFDIQYGVNPASTMIPMARQTGLTRAVATPILSRGGGGHKDDSGAEEFSGGGGVGDADPPLFAGQAAIVSLASGQSDLVIRPKAAVTLDLGEAGARAAGSRGAAMVLVRSAFEDARAYARNRGAYDRGATREFGLSRIDLEALVPVVEARTPLLVRVSRASDILQVLKLARDEKIKVIIEGAEEGWMVAPQLAAAGVPVMIDTERDLPDSFETLASRLDNAARLQAAGVTVAVMGSRDQNNLRQARFNAGMAVSYGLPYSSAIASLTLAPAKIWGMDGQVGSLEVGKTADVVVWNGDPLELSTWPTAVFIGGVKQPEDSRAFELRDRYAAPAGSYPKAYTKP